MLDFLLDYIRKFEYSEFAMLIGYGKRPSSRVVRKLMQDNLRFFEAGIFAALAHPTRIAIVELLRDEGEILVTFLHARLGLEPANISQHLAVLRAKRLVRMRKDGNQIFCSLCDTIISQVLDLMGHYFHSHVAESLNTSKLMRCELPAEKQ
ncbi:MAG: metalloregulator ArsR/SmtB family transcription factor [Planctomycetota bacterium]